MLWYSSIHFHSDVPEFVHSLCIHTEPLKSKGLFTQQKKNICLESFHSHNILSHFSRNWLCRWRLYNWQQQKNKLVLILSSNTSGRKCSLSGFKWCTNIQMESWWQQQLVLLHLCHMRKSSLTAVITFTKAFGVCWPVADYTCFVHLKKRLIWSVILAKNDTG